MTDVPGGVCDYCNADEGRCWDDCPTVKVKKQADEIERLREYLHVYVKEVKEKNAEIERLREALTICDRVLHFNLRKMIIFGDDYNQAVKDAADAASSALQQKESE